MNKAARLLARSATQWILRVGFFDRPANWTALSHRDESAMHATRRSTARRGKRFGLCPMRETHRPSVYNEYTFRRKTTRHVLSKSRTVGCTEATKLRYLRWCSARADKTAERVSAAQLARAAMDVSYLPPLSSIAHGRFCVIFSGRQPENGNGTRAGRLSGNGDGEPIG
jgi:hypothetical protein